jgi:cellulose synthase/poly-beta-1,6-N-acetylglucosamine synthase-like glycosyltransferase
MVIVTLPAYNEEATLATLLERIRESMQENGIEYRVIVVNDGSSDGKTAGGKVSKNRLDITQHRPALRRVPVVTDSSKARHARAQVAAEMLANEAHVTLG